MQHFQLFTLFMKLPFACPKFLLHKIFPTSYVVQALLDRKSPSREFLVVQNHQDKLCSAKIKMQISVVFDYTENIHKTKT